VTASHACAGFGFFTLEAGGAACIHDLRTFVLHDSRHIVEIADEGGPGNGEWNLGQYLVARGSDLPLRDLEIEMLPPLPNEEPKGMAEVVMIPIVPAILNAIFDATGKRFDALPVTSAMIKGAFA